MHACEWLEHNNLRFPLRAKITILITTLLLGTVLVVTTFLLSSEVATLEVEMTKRGLTIANNLAAGAKNALLANDDLTLNALVQDALKDQDIVYIIIADNDGMIQAHKDMSLVNKRLQRPAELKPVGKDTLIQSYTAPGAEQLFDISLPLVYSGVRVGSLYLGFSQKTIHQSLADARNRALAVAGAMIAARHRRCDLVVDDSCETDPQLGSRDPGHRAARFQRPTAGFFARRDRRSDPVF